MTWRDKIVQRIHRWLQLAPYTTGGWLNTVIHESSTDELEIIADRLWYRGNADELRQFYSKFKGSGAYGDTGCSRFWAAVPCGPEIRKIHSGLPGNIVDTLAALVLSDYDGLDIEQSDMWAVLEEATDFDAVLDTAIRETLITGDGAFKLSWDRSQSEHPILCFVPADHVSYRMIGGSIAGIHFYSNYAGKNAKEIYQLDECYTHGHIRYTLRDRDGGTVPLNTVPDLAGLQDITLPDGILAAVPLRFFGGGRPGRGKSIYAHKTDAFDALDEIVSQWVDAVRAGRVQKYIPQTMIPHDPETGRLLPVDSFGTNFVMVTGSSDEASGDQIKSVQPEIRYEAFLSSYTAILDMCLQGILSPATLGINISAEASGESQRQRKDITGFTRNAITGVLERAIPAVATLLLQLDDWLHGRPIGDYAPSVSFGEYAAPDFSSRVQTVAAAASAGIMSVRAQVEQLWGGSKSDDWIDQEVERIKEEQGVAVLPEGSGQDDLP